MLSKIARLRSELDIVRRNCKVMSEMLTEMVPGQEDASDLELLQVLKPSLFPFCSPFVFLKNACVRSLYVTPEYFSNNEPALNSPLGGVDALYILIYLLFLIEVVHLFLGFDKSNKLIKEPVLTLLIEASTHFWFQLIQLNYQSNLIACCVSRS